MKFKIFKYTITIEKEVVPVVEVPVVDKTVHLPIELIPDDSQEFLKELLQTKEATITTIFQDGTEESKIWKADKMDSTSNVIGNLRSRAEFRNGNWQKANIQRVVVNINHKENDLMTNGNTFQAEDNLEVTEDSSFKPAQAIALVNKELNLRMHSKNTNLSNINNSTGMWSVEPNCDRKTHTLYLLLNNSHSRKIHVFEIPANDDIYNKLYLREDKNVYRLVFEVDDKKFIEKATDVDLLPFRKHVLNYNKP